MISIIIPCRNEERYISKCLNSILNSDLSFDDYEIIVVDGNSSDNTKNIVNGFAKKTNKIILLDNPDKTVPFAMNLGIMRSIGDVIIRLDAHCEYNPNYFKYVVSKLKEYDADNVGTIIKTKVHPITKMGNAIIKVTSDKYGVGNSLFRTGIDKPTEVDTVPFGCYKRNIFDKVGLYDERLDKSQDLELNKRIKAAGGKIILLPDFPITYYARSSLTSLFTKYMTNGKWNLWVAYITNSFKSLSYRSFIPTMFVFSFIILGALSFNLYAKIFFVSFVVAYLMMITYRSIYLSDKKTPFPLIILAFIVLHFSHGIGGFIGFLSLLLPSKVHKIKKRAKWTLSEELTEDNLDYNSCSSSIY